MADFASNPFAMLDEEFAEQAIIKKEKKKLQQCVQKKKEPCKLYFVQTMGGIDDFGCIFGIEVREGQYAVLATDSQREQMEQSVKIAPYKTKLNTEGKDLRALFIACPRLDDGDTLNPKTTKHILNGTLRNFGNIGVRDCSWDIRITQSGKVLLTFEKKILSEETCLLIVNVLNLYKWEDLDGSIDFKKDQKLLITFADPKPPRKRK